MLSQLKDATQNQAGKPVSWENIPGTDGYQASTDSQIRNKRGRLLKQRRAANGAMMVDIGKSTAMVHNLVAAAFGDKPLRPVGRRCSKGHSLDDAERWGARGHRVCAACLRGERRVMELPEVL